MKLTNEGEKPAGALIIAEGDLPTLVACTLEVQRAEVDRTPEPVVWSRHEAAPIAQRLAGHFGLRIARQGPASGVMGVDRSRLLIEAGACAVGMGIARVVWPVHGGSGRRPTDLDLDAAAREADRALLVTRLLALDGDDHNVHGIVVDAPLADLSDKQLVELALDLDAPLRLCPWWGDATSDEYERWMAALDACGEHASLS